MESLWLVENLLLPAQHARHFALSVSLVPGRAPQCILPPRWQLTSISKRSFSDANHAHLEFTLVSKNDELETTFALKSK